jgi:hypothetical protein
MGELATEVRAAKVRDKADDSKFLDRAKFVHEQQAKVGPTGLQAASTLVVHLEALDQP